MTSGIQSITFGKQDSTAWMKGDGMEIGEKIRKPRADAGMTQDELAAKLLVTRTAVSK